jgi:hypothetical protein
MHDGAALLGDLDTAHPIRQRIGEILLDETLFANAARKPLHAQRPAPQQRQHRIGDLTVVVDEIALGDPFLRGGVRKQHPIRVRDFDLNAWHQ